MIIKRNIIYDLKVKDERLIGLYVGMWCGDGTQYLDKGYRIKICCNTNNQELICFVVNLMQNLFGKKTSVRNEERHNSLVRFKSKFIFNFIYNYVKVDGVKTYSVSLKEDIDNYSNDFLDGFFLGLMLTDGYLKKRLCFNVVSKDLSKNMSDVLIRLGFKPHLYIHDRKKYGWKDLYQISLNKNDSKEALIILNKILDKISFGNDFYTLKSYKKSEPAVI